METLFRWFREYNTEITWFVIGWLALATCNQLYEENYAMALIDIALAYWNYFMWRKGI